MLSKISELQERQIINIADGKCLGSIKDIELDWEKGVIKSLVLPQNSSFWGLLQNKDELLIPWEQVVRIGIDVILVDFTPVAVSKSRKIRHKQESEQWQLELEAYQDEISEFQKSNQGKLIFHLD